MLLDVRYPGGRETTVCIRDLCPCPASLCPPVNPGTSNVSDVSHTVLLVPVTVKCQKK